MESRGDVAVGVEGERDGARRPVAAGYCRGNSGEHPTYGKVAVNASEAGLSPGRKWMGHQKAEQDEIAT